jgi:hypothetical protein
VVKSPAESAGLPAHPDDQTVENVTSQAEEIKGLLANQSRLEEAIERLVKDAPVPKEESTGPPEGVRSFVAPAHPNGKFMVKPGKLIQAPSPDGPRDIRREGDIWAKFSGGVLITDEPEVIAWCEKHPDICRDAFDPQTEVWVALREAQRETATRGASLPPSLDVAKLLQGDMSGLGDLSSLTRHARRAAGGK